MAHKIRRMIKKNSLCQIKCMLLCICSWLNCVASAQALEGASAAAPAAQAVLGHIELTPDCLPARPADAPTIAGTSALIATVTTYGTLGTAVVMKSSGSSELDGAAVESVKKCPVRLGRDRFGRPLESRVLIVVNWKEQGPGQAGSLLALNLASNPQCSPRYSWRTKDEHPTGPTRVAMQVEQDGSLSAVAIAESSGSTRLDGAAMNAVAFCALSKRPFTDSHLTGPALAFTSVEWLR